MRRLTYEKKALIASAIGYAMDGFDLLILSFTLGAISTDLHLSPSQAGSLVTFTLLGAVAGGLLFGALSDRLGRIRVLNWTILLFALFTGLCAIAQGYEQLLFFRAMAGLGLGGEFGIGMALAAEASPADRRSRASAFVALGWQAGVLLAAYSSQLLLPLIGWRGMFALGVLPAIVSFVVRRWVREEPEAFVQGRSQVLPRIPFAFFVRDASTVKSSLGVLLLCAVQNFGYFSFMIWLPSYLSSQLQFTLTRSALWTGVTVLGMCVGIWTFGQLADRAGRRPIFLIFQAGAAIMALVYARLETPMALLGGGAILGMFVNGMMGGYGALISELYPTAVRATAQNVLFNLGRAVGGLGPWVVGLLLADFSFPAVVGFLSLIYVADMMAILWLIPERRGCPLSEGA